MTQPKTKRVANNRTNNPRHRQPTRGNSRRRQNNGNSKSANPKIKFDDYTSRALAAAASGDLIAAENLYQHAEHYYRMMNID